MLFYERLLLLSIALAAIFINYLLTVRWNMQQQHSTPRPYLKSSLARYIYDKIINDDDLKEQHKIEWYQVELNSIRGDLRDSFIQFHCDEETQQFLDNCYEKSDWLFTQLYYSVAKMLLGWFMTQTSLNGLLGRGSMFVFSRDQLQKLLSVEDVCMHEKVLDIGAGDGAVTEKLSGFFHSVHVTEMSGVMQRCLISRGYILEEVEFWKSCKSYNTISFLNVLDRCSKPLTMLHHIRSCLSPGGVVILAVVLPFATYVEQGEAEERLNITGCKWENQFNSLVEDVLEPAGFKVKAWSKVPYLCEGDLNQPFYWLTDALLILEPS